MSNSEKHKAKRRQRARVVEKEMKQRKPKRRKVEKRGSK